MNVEIITVGNEIITGLILDANAAFLSETVFSVGARVTRIVSVGDEVETIASTLTEAMTRAELVLVTGGLGPTPDDRTAEAAAHALGRKLTLHRVYLDTLRAKFQRWKLTLTATDERMAYLPKGAEALQNPIGLCGFKIVEGAKNIFFFPGVPREVAKIAEGELLPFLIEKMSHQKQVIKSILLKAFGPTEAQVKELLQGIEGDFELAYLPSFPEIRLKVIVRGSDEGEVEEILKRYANAIAERLGIFFFGRGDEVMEGVVGKLLLAKAGTIAVAESCTGGLIAHRITEIPGSSSYFLRGVVAYSNQAKEALLGVPHSILESYGPVSRETAEHMARGVRGGNGATIGVATTGILGPAGGTPEIPVGRVFVSLATEGMCEVKQYDFFGDRHAIKLMASEVALDRIRRYLLSL